ncbi:MAG: hypothetical protein ACOYEC_02605 [Christensenellales bacterium]|jgi:hypothetical protein|nr:hypothetical protein [Clostridiales bacterium]
MEKSLYSLILSDDVVKRIDEIARSKNTNRSNLVNQILADYVSYVTPEKKICGIFNSIAQMLNNDIFTAFFDDNNTTMSLKSSLDYKYRPTIKYEVELFRSSKETIGELKVIFRTQSASLLMELNSFFKLWARLESIYLSPYYPAHASITYNLEAGRFYRAFRMPLGKSYSDESIARAISNYIKMFDEILKGYLSNKYQSARDIEDRYLQYLNSGIVII